MNYPFERKTSHTLTRMICIAAAAVLMAAMFSGCFKKEASEPSSDPTLPTPNLVDPTPSSSEAPTETTQAPAPTEAPKTNVAIVKEQVAVRSLPSTTNGQIISQLNAGDEVEINRIESVGAVQWAYIPLKGWVTTEHLDMSNVTISSGSTATPGATNPTTSTTAPTTANNGGTTTGSGTSGVVTTDVLNIRSTASTNATIVGRYTKGTTIKILETSNGWGRTDKGWVSMQYVNTSGTTTNTGTDNTNNTTTTTNGKFGVVITDTLNIRESGSTNADKVGQYTYGTGITILETSNGWGRTDKGWVSMQYVYLNGATGSKTAKGLVVGSQLNVRSGPGTTYKAVATYGQLTRVNILEQVTLNGTTWGCTKDGWISLDYVYIDGTKGDGAGTGTVTGDNVNIRSGPGTKYDSVGSVSSGDEIEILAQFTINDVTWGCTEKGWICMDYVGIG